MDRLLDLEAEEKVPKAPMTEAPADAPDIHPNIAGIYRRRSSGWQRR
jgi:site-specific DNA recombinase